MFILIIAVLSFLLVCLLASSWYLAFQIQQGFATTYTTMKVASELATKTADDASIIKVAADRQAIVLAKVLRLTEEAATARQLLLVVVDRTGSTVNQLAANDVDAIALLRQIIAQQQEISDGNSAN